MYKTRSFDIISKCNVDKRKPRVVCEHGAISAYNNPTISFSVHIKLCVSMFEQKQFNFFFSCNTL